VQRAVIIYVTEQGALVNKRQGRLIVTKGPNLLQSIHLFDLEQLVLFGQIQVSTQALRALLLRGVDTVYLTLSGKYLGRLSSGTSKNIALRREQFRQLDDPQVALTLARHYVRGKLLNCMMLLRRHNKLLRHEGVARDTVAIRRCLERIEEVDSVESLRGLEGAGSARYFSALKTIFRAPGMAFFRRARRPPPDPVNILLSLGYTMLGNMVQGMCEGAGLDPFLGALHCISYGRPSLALDLMEEFRPVIVDSAAIRAVNTRQIGENDFLRLSDEETEAEADLWRQQEEERTQSESDVAEEGERGIEEEQGAEGREPPPLPRQVMITSGGLKKWILAYERRLDEQTYYEGTGTKITYRQLLREQVYRFARHLRGKETYAPFLMRW
jgi:CRISPR-associated protein Cas1